MHSYCYFRYYQNINYQQVLPQAFVKSLKTDEKNEQSNPMRASRIVSCGKWEVTNYTSLSYHVQEIDVLKISNN